MARCVESVAVSIVFSSAQPMMEDVNVCRSCDLLEHFHHLGVEHAPLAIDKLLSHTAVKTKQEELSHLAKRFLTTTKSQSSLPLLHFQQNPSPIPQRGGTNQRPQLQLVGHGKVIGLGVELIVNTPEKGARMHGIETQMSTTHHKLCKSSADGAVQVAYSSAEGLHKR